MVLGVFFSEVGYKLLGLFSNHDSNISEVRKNLLVTANWADIRFATALKTVKRYKGEIEAAELNLGELSTFLSSKRDFLLGLLENPVLIEHDDFSDALLSVFHLLDELTARNELSSLPESDIKHLTGDINRVYIKLIIQWVIYLRHLKGEYPFLFSLAMRTNPFNENASAVVV
jgi:hypothetical protein